jgi:hypothetical protein
MMIAHRSLRDHLQMDNLPLLLGIMAVTLLLAALNSWRQGNEKRDVALLGILGSLFGLGTALTAYG